MLEVAMSEVATSEVRMMMLNALGGFGRNRRNLKPFRALARRCGLWVGLGLAQGACTRGQEAVPTVPAPASASPSSAPGASSAAAETEASELTEVLPVYPAGPVEAEPRAKRLCAALYEVQARQRAACCGRPPRSGGQTMDECTRLLSLGLQQGAIALEGPALEACVGVLEKSARPCSEQGRFDAASPAPCQAVVTGRRVAGAICRSHLECEGSLQCLGVGPTQTGICAGPRPLGAPCGAGADVLVTYARQPEAGSRHPECDGTCSMHRCAALTPIGGACVGNLQCGEGRACVARKCAPEPRDLQEGAACPGAGCAAGTRCIAGRCGKPAVAGTACSNDFECEGACLKAAILDKTGVCGVFCQ